MHLFVLSPAIFSPTTDHGKSAAKAFRVSFLPLLPFDRDTSAKARKYRVIADFDFSTVWDFFSRIVAGVPQQGTPIRDANPFFLSRAEEKKGEQK